MGQSPQILDEAERALNNALWGVVLATESRVVVPGGSTNPLLFNCLGAVEMHLSTQLEEWSNIQPSGIRSIVLAFSRALLVIPKLLASNSGHNSLDVIAKLQWAHANNHKR